MKRRFAWVATVGLVLGTGAARAAVPTRSSTEPRLVVVVSVDGLSWPRLEAYRPWFVGGLKRLLDEGRVETQCRYRHLNTETGPGHSSLSTGAPPRISGIVGNRWFEQNADGSIREVGCAQQPNPVFVPGTPPLFYQEVEKDGRIYVFAMRRELMAWEQSGETGKVVTRLGAGPKGETLIFDSDDAIALFNFRHGLPKEATSPRGTITGPGNLRVPTLGDVLTQARPGARVVSLSAKDRSATLLAGRDPRHAVYWFDQATGRFTSSGAYDTDSPPGAAATALVARFNTERGGPMLPSRFGTRWARLPLATALKAPTPAPLWAPVAGTFNPYPTPALLDFQIPSNGLDFDHTLISPNSGYFASLYVSPFIDELLADLALAFLNDEPYGLGRGKQPDLLALSFSAQDVVSHSYGNESEENLDTLRRLDVQLERMLEVLDRQFPKGSVVVALSADHGFSPIPESEKRWDKSLGIGRLMTGARGAMGFVERLNRLMADALCLPSGSRVIHGGEGFGLIYNRPGLPMRTVEGACGPPNGLVTAAEVDLALPKVMGQFFREEILEVLLVSKRAQWSSDDPAVEFAKNDFDSERSGDALLIPRPYVLMHWDPARGSGHGSIYDYDTHVPLIFWGGPFRSEAVAAASTPYDLAPTLARLLSLDLKDAVGKSRLP